MFLCFIFLAAFFLIVYYFVILNAFRSILRSFLIARSTPWNSVNPPSMSRYAGHISARID